MQDPRIRIAAGAFLSVAAFISLHGAAAVFMWWLVFTNRLQTVKRIPLVFSLLFLIAFFSLVLEVSGGGGVSYFIRMSVILLIGMWIYDEQRSGDFLRTGAWLFGDRIGFETGMIAEMGMQSIAAVSLDLERIRIAEKIKGKRWGIRSLVPAGLVLVHGALVRAEETAELLAVRGYLAGGTVCPEFVTAKLDLVAGCMVIVIVLIAMMPVSDFFILYR